jgi:hypothetical protein
LLIMVELITIAVYRWLFVLLILVELITIPV